MPRQWKGRTFYTPAELAEMTPERREQVREAHRPLAFVRPDELPADYALRTREAAAQQVMERDRDQHGEAS